MCSSISWPSKPKNIARCENCNKPILFYQERICYLGEKIAYGQDGKVHQCHIKPSNEEPRCLCECSVHLRGESKRNDFRTSLECAIPIHAVTDLKTKTIIVLDCVSQLLNHLQQEVEKSRDTGGV